MLGREIERGREREGGRDECIDDFVCMFDDRIDVLGVLGLLDNFVWYVGYGCLCVCVCMRVYTCVCVCRTVCVRDNLCMWDSLGVCGTICVSAGQFVCFSGCDLSHRC